MLRTNEEKIEKLLDNLFEFSFSTRQIGLKVKTDRKFLQDDSDRERQRKGKKKTAALSTLRYRRFENQELRKTDSSARCVPRIVYRHLLAKEKVNYAHVYLVRYTSCYARSKITTIFCFRVGCLCSTIHWTLNNGCKHTFLLKIGTKIFSSEIQSYRYHIIIVIGKFN